MLKKLVLHSIMTVNAGYTAFLFPLLGVLYPDRVPLTFYNLLAFMLVDTVWGAILAVIVYLVARLARIGLARAITYSIVMMWTIFWFTMIPSSGGTITSLDNVIVVGADGVAALITWATLSRLVKHYTGT